MKHFNRFLLAALCLAMLLTLHVSAAEPVWEEIRPEDAWSAAPSVQLMGLDNAKLQAMVKKVRTAIWNGDEYVDLYYDDYDADYATIKLAMNALFFAPDTFAMNTCSTSQRSTYVRIQPLYYSDVYNNYDAAKAVYLAGINEVVSQVRSGWSDLEKVLFVHDWLCVNFQYDYTYSRRDAYLFFRDKAGVCQAYTRAFIGVMDALGIESTYVSSDELNHTWNAVKLNGKWYHLDATWDDPTMKPVKQAKHTFFLLSDSEMMTRKSDTNSHSAGDWVYGLDISCNDTSLDGRFWKDGASPFLWHSGKWYLVTETALLRCDPNTGSTEKLVPFDTLFKSLYPLYSFGDNYVWTSGLTAHGGKLYFNTWYDLLSYDLSGGSVDSLLSTITDGYNLYSCYLEGNKLIFQTSEPKFYSIELAAAATYKITWLDDDGSLLGETTVQAGELPSFPDPVRENDEVFTYTFMGWEPEVVPATANATYTARWLRMDIMYTITWLNDDGSVFATTWVMPTMTPFCSDTPTKASDGMFDYEFFDWDPMVQPAYGDATYTAVFNRTLHGGTRSTWGGYSYKIGANSVLILAEKRARLFCAYYDGSGRLTRLLTASDDELIEAQKVSGQHIVIYSLGLDNAPRCAALRLF